MAKPDGNGNDFYPVDEGRKVVGYVVGRRLTDLEMFHVCQFRGKTRPKPQP